MTAAKPSQRERLLARPRPSVRYTMVVDPDGLAAAQEALTAALVEQRKTARFSPRSKARRTADRAMREAQQQLEACYETVVFTALPTDGDVTVESLMAAHPPTAEQLAEAEEKRRAAEQRGETPQPLPAWNPVTYPPALLAACCDNGMSAEDWAEFLAYHCSAGERRRLWAAVLAVNERERVADPLVIPKGLTTILSSVSS